MFEHLPNIGTTAFERIDGEYIYYARAWSKGVPVSAAARQAYLFGPRSEWFEAMSGTAAIVPRRPYWRTLKRILIAILQGHDPAEPKV